MRILYISSGFPYPLTSGYLRHYHFIKRLSQHHKIVLVSNVSATFKKEDIDGIAPYVEQVIPIRHIFANKPTLANHVMNRMLVTMDANPAILEMRNELKRLLQEQRFDLMILSGAHTVGAIRGLDTPPIVADMCDAKSERLRKQMASTSSPVWKIWLRYKLQEMLQIEQRIIDRSVFLLFASERDRLILRPKDRERSFVVANGVDTDYWKRSTPSLGQHKLIFTGAMHFPPNVDTAMHLIHDILPGVRRKIPDAELMIVGHSPTKQLIEAGKREGVQVTGFVDDIRPYMEQSTVFVSPMHFGSGIQNKLLEAMAMAMPIVTSSVAGDGVRYNGAEPPFFVQDDVNSFVRCTVDLLQQSAANPVPAYQARDYVERHFTWESNAQRLHEILQAVK